MSRFRRSTFLQARDRVVSRQAAEAATVDVDEPRPTFVEWLERGGVHPEPYQRVFCRVAFDDVDPIDLEPEERAMAREIFGDVDRFPPEAKSVICMTKGGRQGGTYFGALWQLYAAEYQDLSGLAPGEVAFCPLVAPDKDTATQARNYAAGYALVNFPDRIVVDKAELLTIRRKDGKIVRLKVFAASRGGSRTRSRSMASAMMDEAAFFYDQKKGVVNDVDIFDSMSVRVLPGPLGKLLVLSTVWLEEGLLHTKMLQSGWSLDIDESGSRYWKHEKTGEAPEAICALCPTFLMFPSEKNRRVYESKLKTDPENARREFDCIPFTSGESQFFPAEWIFAATQLEIPKDAAVVGGTGADFGFTHDSAALAHVKRTHLDDCYLKALEELRPEGEPLKVSVTVKHFANVAKTYGDDVIAADGHYRESVDEHLLDEGVALFDAPAAQHTPKPYILTRSLLGDGRLGLLDHPKLIEQLKNTQRVALSGGKISIKHPRNKSGHGDLVVALVNAVWRAYQLAKPEPPKVYENEGEKWEDEEWREIDEANEEERVWEEIENRY